MSETKDGIVATLLPVDANLLTPQEIATIELIKEWFFVDLSLPTLQDLEEKLNLGKLSAAKTRIRRILCKTSLLHYYQVPFLRLGEEQTRKIDFVEVNPKRRISPLGVTEDTTNRPCTLFPKERDIIKFTKGCFFRTLVVPSWPEISAHCNIASLNTAKHHFSRIGAKTGICQCYQIPFIRIPN